MKKLVLASGNAGKLGELRAMLAGLALQITAQGEFGVQDVPETGLTFIENALIKARHACLMTGFPALADDSGLIVDALGGAPGCTAHDMLVPRRMRLPIMPSCWRCCVTFLRAGAARVFMP